jgi:acetoin utilization protein AcuC
MEVLTRLHDCDYVEALKAASARGAVTAAERERYRFGTMENPIFPGLYERASATVGGSMLAVKLALDGAIAFHPAGGTHHGKPDQASGFCYFNDPAFAILAFLDAGIQRVAYVDVDAHHGDGVFDAFASDERVCCVSIHEDNRWPHTGTIAQQSPRSLNVPVPFGINDSEYDAIMARLVLPVIERFAPQALVVTCGADALHGDPLSKMELSNGALWRTVLQLCQRADAAVVVGGGGYNPWTTTRCWAGLWGVLAGHDIPDTLPEPALALLAGFESDLVEEDEIEPYWLTTLLDPPRPGPIREAIEGLITELARVHCRRTAKDPIH